MRTFHIGGFTVVEIECLWECNDGLGETPIWLAEDKSIYWADHVNPEPDPTDARPPSIRSFNIETGERKTWEMPEQIGSFGFRRGGGMIGGGCSGFFAIDLENRRVDTIVNPEPGRPHSRLNDGKVDRYGRFWCGSMDVRFKDKSSYLYCLEPDRTYRKADKDFRFVVANGIAFDPEDTRMYFGDTFGHMVYVFDLDINDGRISNRRPFFSIEDRQPGIVDGATVDTEGFYWFALNLGGKILRVDPKGRLDREIDLPIRSPTCIAFGGNNYETLFVTSQQSFLTKEELARHPQPGCILAVHGLGVQGLPEPKFGS
ncbi:SMP-30/gluconolactonase/LRE family protein [Microbulbifer sp. ANSA005]|uniref:SMP-30/gluconolactonase/LRE family protein n=1 Tax=Microbulbifer sp. ANSA005 TaxID=3243362 RepID=UPI0040427CC5